MNSKTYRFMADIVAGGASSLRGGQEGRERQEKRVVFSRTDIFPDRAVKRLVGALAGYDVLFVVKPEGKPAAHDVDVRLARREGVVLARKTYVDRAP
jgi:hypothetical protein